MRPGRTIVAPAVVLATAVITGGWFLQRGAAQEQSLYLQARLLEEVIDHVEEQYVEDVEREDLYRSAIDGLLDELGDPNTSFIDATAYENFRIRTQGDYGGVGLEIVERDGFITVVSPIPGTPGARAGIRAGDRFVTIEGQDARGWEVEDAVDILRGQPGSEVDVEIRRVGVDEPIPFTLTRARIELRAVPFSTVLEGGVGYVPLQMFRERSSEEVRAAVDSVRDQGARSLVLDLRGNPGGLLEQGIGVSDLFLGEGRSVVETRGRARGQDETYATSDPGAYDGLPVVVLVSETSASASEIVAGALQDHDRALVVGNTSYGKGSVQTLYRLSGGNVLRLTTARWYTPVGRSIMMTGEQREARALGEQGTLTLDGSLTELPDTAERPTFESMAGRTLYGGGGITPDLVVLADTLTSDEQRAVRALYRQAGTFNQALFNFASRYIQEHPDLPPRVPVTPSVLDEFYAALQEADVEIDREVYDDASRFVRYHVGREIALQAGGEAREFEQVRDDDLQLRRAVELLSRASSPQDLFQLAGAAGGAGMGAEAALSPGGSDDAGPDPGAR